MARIRADYVFGTTDAALTASDTTLSSPALSRLPAVASPDVAAVTLHDAAAGTYEIVHVTAHTAAATTATILRGQEGSTAAAWGSGTSWNHGPTAFDINDSVPADQTPSLDEIAASWNLPIAINSTVSYGLFTAPFPLTVEAFGFSGTFAAGIPASDSTYWTVELRRLRGLTLTTSQTDVIATKTTKVTSAAGIPGEAMPYRGDWNFDQATFSATNKVLQKGDIVAVAFLKTGAPNDISFPGGYVRYVPA